MHKILLIQLRQLGDILLTTPCIRAVRAAYPEASISFLSHGMGRLVLQDNPFLNHAEYYDSSSWLNELRLLRRLRAERFDLVLDYMNNPRSALYSLATGAPQRLAFHSRRAFAYTHTVPRRADSDYIVREKFRLLAAVGIAADQEQLTLPWSAAELGPFQALCAALPSFATARLRIVLSPTTRRHERSWPMAHYAALADRFLSLPDTAVLWIWGPGEEAEIDEVIALTKGQSIKAPPTKFRELAALLAQCELFVGNSNGPSHAAVSVNMATLQLHGLTQARAWSPLNDAHHALQAQGGDLTQLSVDRVWSEYLQMAPLLEKKADARQLHGVKHSYTACL